MSAPVISARRAVFSLVLAIVAAYAVGAFLLGVERTLRSVAAVCLFLGVVLLVTVAVDSFVAWLNRVDPPAVDRTPDTDAQAWEDSRVAVLVIIAILGLAVEAFDHPSTWPAPPTTERVKAVTSAL